MTLQSSSSNSEIVAASGPSSSTSSTSTSSTDVFPLPYSIGQKEIVLNNEDRTLVTEVGDNNILSTPGANVSIIESSDVHLGNRTAFNGDVTIYQYINGHNIPNGAVGQDEVECKKTGQVVNLEKQPADAKPFPKDIKKLLKHRPTQLWIAAFLLAVMSIVGLSIFFSLNYTFPPTTSPIAPSTGHDDDLGDGIQVIQRKEWLARPPLNVTKIAHPLRIARILHTGGSNCADYQTCANKVLAMQGWQVGTKGMPDLAYNYMIGGDGNVYVGRGAGVENEWMPSAIDIGYIGNFLGPYDKMTNKMDQAGRRLVAKLRKDGYLTPDYIVIAQNQTFNTQSPGENIFKKIIKWPHYDSGLYFK